MTRQQAAAACPESLPLLARYPVTLPLILLAGAAAAGCASVFSGSLFPILAVIGFSAAPFCLAFVLGVAGILAGIISMLEYIDRHHLRSTSGSGQKGA